MEYISLAALNIYFYFVQYFQVSIFYVKWNIMQIILCQEAVYVRGMGRNFLNNITTYIVSRVWNDSFKSPLIVFAHDRARIILQSIRSPLNLHGSGNVKRLKTINPTWSTEVPYDKCYFLSFSANTNRKFHLINSSLPPCARQFISRTPRAKQTRLVRRAAHQGSQPGRRRSTGRNTNRIIYARQRKNR